MFFLFCLKRLTVRFSSSGCLSPFLSLTTVLALNVIRTEVMKWQKNIIMHIIFGHIKSLSQCGDNEEYKIIFNGTGSDVLNRFLQQCVQRNKGNRYI